MPEWSIGPHSKCGVGATLPGVRIPLFPQPATPPFGGLLLSKGKPRSPTLRADRGKQKRSSEAARCGLLAPPLPGCTSAQRAVNPLFPQPATPPFGGLLLSKGKPRSPTLRADRGKQKRSSEAARCGLLAPPLPGCTSAQRAVNPLFPQPATPPIPLVPRNRP